MGGRPGVADRPLGQVRRVEQTSGPTGDIARRAGVRSSVANPIVVEGRRWGAMVVLSRTEPLPPGTEGRMADFTELVAVAVADAEARSQLRRIAEEQSALRRVATLVAQAGSPSLVFGAVTARSACPILVGGRLWGVIAASTKREESFRPTPRPRSRRSPSWSPPRSRMPRAAPSWRRRGPGWSPPPTRPGGGWSATCTTAPSSGWSLSPCGCVPPRRRSPPGPGRGPPGVGRRR